jgi:hypothetical protein
MKTVKLKEARDAGFNREKIRAEIERRGEDALCEIERTAKGVRILSCGVVIEGTSGQILEVQVRPRISKSRRTPGNLTLPRYYTSGSRLCRDRKRAWGTRVADFDRGDEAERARDCLNGCEGMNPAAIRGLLVWAKIIVRQHAEKVCSSTSIDLLNAMIAEAERGIPAEVLEARS